MIRILVLALMLVWAMPQTFISAQEQTIKEKYEESVEIYAASNACLATYDDQVGNLFYNFLQNDGWKIENYSKTTKLADANIFLASRHDIITGETVYIVSFRGTVSRKDRRVDMRTQQVLFKGNNPVEIARNAQMEDLTADVPQVHKGFLDYVLVAFEMNLSEESSKNGYEHLYEILKNNPKARVIVTGHSLGGAVATVYAASIYNMGVPKEQVKVITFGAPTVGNETFAEQYKDKINLLRVYSPYDPVPGTLQMMTDYKQFGRTLPLSTDARFRTIQHNMDTYADMVAKYYYDCQEEAIEQGVIDGKPVVGDEGDGKIVAIIVTTADDIYKLNEYKHAKQDLLEKIRRSVLRYRIIEPEKKKFTNLEASDLAKEHGADYLLLIDINILRDKMFKSWVVEMSQGIFNVADDSFGSAVLYSHRVARGTSFFQASSYNGFRIINYLEENYPELMRYAPQK